MPPFLCAGVYFVLLHPCTLAIILSAAETNPLEHEKYYALKCLPFKGTSFGIVCQKTGIRDKVTFLKRKGWSECELIVVLKGNTKIFKYFCLFLFLEQKRKA